MSERKYINRLLDRIAKIFLKCKGNLVNVAPKMKVCANCKHTYAEEDKYCRYCGAPLGKPDYIEENFSVIYGPPHMKRVHKCAECGYTWETNLMIDNDMWCPKCGGAAPVKSEEEWL